MDSKQKSHLSLSGIEKIALEVAELANREIELTSNNVRFLAESRRTLEELRTVSAAKAEKLRLLASGGNGSATADSGKESVYKLIAAKPSHVFQTSEVIKALGINKSTASVYLSELSEKERRIRRVKKGQYQALPLGGAIAVSSPTLPSATAHDGLPDRILALLESEPKTTFTALDICKLFSFSDKKDIDAVRNALSRLARFVKIERASHGKYLALPREVSDVARKAKVT